MRDSLGVGPSQPSTPCEASRNEFDDLFGDVRFLKGWGGFVLGEIGDRSIVSPLMDALVTEHIINNPLARNPNSITPSFSSDGGIGMQQGSAQPKLLKLTKKNEAVLDALRQLTKADYGFDENRWKDWYAEQYTLVDLDVRRDD